MFFTTINNLRIAYRKIGVGKKKIIVLHGWGIDSNYFIPLAEQLADEFEIYIPDLPGFGQSDQPLKLWTLDDYVDFVLRFVKSQRIEKFYLFGHSFGGRIAIKLAANLPMDLLEKLILCGAAGIKEPLNARQKIAKALALIGKGIPFTKNKLFKKILYKIAGQQDYFRATPQMKEILKKVIQEDLTSELPKIKFPTLLIWGREDVFTPLWQGKKMARLIPNSKLKIISGGHNIYRIYPKEVGEIIKQNIEK